MSMQMESLDKALGNYVSNLAHTYFLTVFTKTVHTWTKVIVNLEIWVKGHKATFREVRIEFSQKG